MSELQFGVDVARFGDDSTVIAGRRGDFAMVVARMNGSDGNQIADRIIEAVREFRQGAEQVSICIDEIGYGSSVIDALAQRQGAGVLDADIFIIGVNVSRTAVDAEKYHSLRDQLWFGMNDWIKDGGTLPEDADLRQELASVQYGFDARGRHQVEPKSEMKRRIGRSPDTADALALAIISVQKPDYFVPHATGRGWDDGGTRGW